MQLTSLRQLAARTYKCSPGTIRFSKPLTKEELTLKRAAVRQLVKKGTITFRKTRGTTRHVAPKVPKISQKTAWIRRIRMLRSVLKTSKHRLINHAYRRIRVALKAGTISTRRRLNAVIDDNSR